MKIKTTILAVALMCAVALPAAAQTVSRMGDEAVKNQMEQIQHGLDRFINGMDPQIRQAVLKSEQSEVNVKNVLDELKDSASKMKDRFNPPTASAGMEVATFLKNAKRFDTGLAQRPGLSGADAKWADLVPEISKLATAYHCDWTASPETWTPARTSDGEIRTAAQTLKKSAGDVVKQFGDAMKKDKTMDAAARTKANEQAVALATAAKGLEDVLKSKGDPSAALGRVKTAGTDLRATIEGYGGAPTAKASWQSASGALEKLLRAYDVPF